MLNACISCALSLLTQATPAWTSDPTDQSSSRFGASVSSAGDVNGDGYDDVLITATWWDGEAMDEGRAFVFHGGPAGLSPGNQPDWTADPTDQAGAKFGWSAAAAGDVNGDGYDDIVVGCIHATVTQVEEGAAYAYLGGPSGLSPTPAWIVAGGQAGAKLGRSVSGAGDVNGDGYDDVIVGAFLYDNGQGAEGVAYVFHGGPSGLSPAADWTHAGQAAMTYFGWSVAGAGDVNGDGFDDVVVGAVAFSDGELYEGGAFLFLGSASGLAAVESWSAQGNQAGAQLGWDLDGAGDVNGDGFADVIVGAPLYSGAFATEGCVFVYHGTASGLSPAPAWVLEGGQDDARQASVAGAGDVDGDGFADAVVGSHLMDGTIVNGGRVSLYPGGPGGLAPTPLWFDEGIQAGCLGFGFSVGTAGDVNGDGASDVIDSAMVWDGEVPDEGRAYVYLGATIPPPTEPDSTAEDSVSPLTASGGGGGGGGSCSTQATRTGGGATALPALLLVLIRSRRRRFPVTT